MNRRFNIMQALRLQLKSGFLKTEPDSYTFMKRYPPLSRNVKRESESARSKMFTLPMAKLYTRAVEKNSLYVDERVYPAYWMHEPQAFTLAKKQYEYMQAGLDEKAAYKKALDYIDEFEDKSYDDLKRIKDTLKVKNAKVPFIIDQNIREKIAHWRKKLNKTAYTDLDLADQGEVDFIIQNDILKWNEIERERRMRDPLFVKQFEELRSTIFPDTDFQIEIQTKNEIKEAKKHYYDFFKLSENDLRANKRFYYEDYVELFEKIVEQPNSKLWPTASRESFLDWIYNTLIFTSVLKSKTVEEVHKYIKTVLRPLFFPMVVKHEKKYNFKLPSVHEFKQILYDNDIGYYTHEGKLYVRRFYLIPRLLFKSEVLPPIKGAEASEDDSRAGSDIDDVHRAMGRDLSSSAAAAASRSASSSSSLKSQLEEIAATSALNRSKTGLNELLEDKDAVQAKDKVVLLNKDLETKGQVIKGGEVAGDMKEETVGGQEISVKEEEEDENEDDGDDDEDGDDDDIDGFDLDDEDLEDAEDDEEDEREFKTTAEFHAALEKADLRLPNTALEQERLELFSSQDELFSNKTLGDLHAYKRMRQDDMVKVRAGLFAQYEEKEAARRAREWKQRGVWMEFPHADLELLEPSESKAIRKVQQEVQGDPRMLENYSSWQVKADKNDPRKKP